MEDLTVKDLEFLIEALDEIDGPVILSKKFAKEAFDKIKSGSFEEMLKAVSNKYYIHENKDWITQAMSDFIDETTMLRAKLIQIRRSKQTAENG